MQLRLSVLPERLAVARLEPGAAFPAWAGGTVLSFTRTATEVSVVCADSAVPAEVRAERGWRALRVAGPLDFALTGILARLANPLAAAGISIFVLSTFDTDYVLVREATLPDACAALERSGCLVAPDA